MKMELVGREVISEAVKSIRGKTKPHTVQRVKMRINSGKSEPETLNKIYRVLLESDDRESIALDVVSMYCQRKNIKHRFMRLISLKHIQVDLSASYIEIEAIVDRF